MRKPIFVLLVSTLVLTSCATARDSRLNPFNWFGRSTSEPVADQSGAAINPLIPARRAGIFRQEQDTSYRGSPIAEVTALVLERRPGGAILRTRGLASRLGPFDVRLVAVEDETNAGTLTYDFSALQPPGPRSAGQRARSVTTAMWLTDQELAGIRTIRVRAASNVRTVRR